MYFFLSHETIEMAANFEMSQSLANRASQHIFFKGCPQKSARKSSIFFTPFLNLKYKAPIMRHFWGRPHRFVNLAALRFVLKS